MGYRRIDHFVCLNQDTGVLIINCHWILNVFNYINKIAGNNNILLLNFCKMNKDIDTFVYRHLIAV